MSSNYKAKIDELIIKLGEEEKRKEEVKKEKEVEDKEKKEQHELKMKERKDKKEKIFAERFGKHFSESSKGINDRVHSLEESMTKLLEMSEKHFAKIKE